MHRSTGNSEAVSRDICSRGHGRHVASKEKLGAEVDMYGLADRNGTVGRDSVDA